MIAKVRRSPSRQEQVRTTIPLMTTLRPSSVCAPKRRTNPSARTTQHSKQRNERRLNSFSTSSPTPGSKKYETPTRFTLRFPQSSYLPISKRVAPAGTPSTSWRCIMKCSITTSRSRASLNILTCSRTHKRKPAGRREQLPTRPYSSSPAH